MKIALISPKGPLYRHRGGIFKKSLRYQPLTLTTLAALVPQDLNAEIAVYDEGIQDVPETLDADIIGLTVITGTAKRSYELAAHYRAQGKTVVLGGPHVTLIPEESVDHADAIVVGYAEDTWPELLRDFARGALKREYRQAHDFSLDRPDMPFPRRDLFDGSGFLTQAVFEATRACAHDCEFCVVPSAWGKRQFQKPVAHIIEDIRRVGQKRILFVDLNLVSDKAYARELFTALVPLKVRWFGLATVLIAHDPELMELMARSGCRGLLLGLESISPGSLGDANKRFNASVDYQALIAHLHDLRIALQGCFVFGLDHDNLDVFDATVEFAIDNAIDLPRFAILTPFPGTPLHTRLAGEGRILTRDWEKYDGQHVVFQPKNMTTHELAIGHERAWKGVYRYGAIARRLWKARALEPLGIAANLGYRFYAHNLQKFYTCDWPQLAGSERLQEGGLIARHWAVGGNAASRAESRPLTPALSPRRGEGERRGIGYADLMQNFRLTFVHPAIGHRAGESYIRTWQMESLPVANLAGLTPAGVDMTFFDDRMEAIDYDKPADAVAIPIETYTAGRAYQIASEYRRRGVPVVMGGFHATLVPDEVSRYAEAVVTGEAESAWGQVIDDLRHGTLKRRYRGEQHSLTSIRVDRSLFRGKRYLPIGLVETGRGCGFRCEFCAIQTFFSNTYRGRPIADVIEELKGLKDQKKFFFFVDDNFAGDLKAGKPLLAELAKLNIRWLTQMSIDAAHDEEFLAELHKAGCRGVLIGFESLNEENLKIMNKRFNTMRTGFRGALANLRKHRIFVYGTFIFGYEHDTHRSFDEAVDFAVDEGMYIAAFNHLTPFPGTPLYKRLEEEGRLRYENWWLDPDYRYNALPFTPKTLTPDEVTEGCVSARRRFYGWPNIVRRSTRHMHEGFVFRSFFLVNAMHRTEISQRNGYPLRDETWKGQLLEVQ